MFMRHTVRERPTSIVTPCVIMSVFVPRVMLELSPSQRHGKNKTNFYACLYLFLVL